MGHLLSVCLLSLSRTCTRAEEKTMRIPVSWLGSHRYETTRLTPHSDGKLRAEGGKHRAFVFNRMHADSSARVSEMLMSLQGSSIGTFPGMCRTMSLCQGSPETNKVDMFNQGAFL